MNDPLFEKIITGDWQDVGRVRIFQCYHINNFNGIFDVLKN
jgi:hypothetical protein